MSDMPRHDILGRSDVQSHLFPHAAWRRERGVQDVPHKFVELQRVYLYNLPFEE